MVRFLSSRWAEEFNTALEDVTIPGPGPDAGLAAADGRFTVVQEVRGGPDGDVRVVLGASDGTLRLHLEHPADGGARLDPADGGAPSDGAHEPPDVTVVISYDDAVAMSKGELAVAEALNSGRIRVRGDLSVLVAAQEMLMAARTSTRDLVASTTY